MIVRRQESDRIVVERLKLSDRRGKKASRGVVCVGGPLGLAQVAGVHYRIDLVAEVDEQGASFTNESAKSVI